MDLYDLEALRQHFARNRGVGNTRALLVGAAHTTCKFIARDGTHAQQLMSEHKGLNAVSSIGVADKLRGYHGPIVLDHDISFQLLQHIDQLEKRLKERDEALAAIHKTSEPGRFR